MLNEMQHSINEEEELDRIKKMKYDIMTKLKKGYKRLIGFETP